MSLSHPSDTSCPDDELYMQYFQIAMSTDGGSGSGLVTPPSDGSTGGSTGGGASNSGGNTGSTGGSTGSVGLAPVTLRCFYPGVICFPKGNSTYAAIYDAYAAQIALYAKPYATMQTAGLDYDAFVVEYAGMSAGATQGAIMINYEYPHLEIAAAPSGSAVQVAWSLYQAVIDERLRQGITLPLPQWTMPVYKQMTEKCFQDISTYALDKGSTHAVHYCTPGWSFSNSDGFPRAGFLDATPASGMDRWKRTPAYPSFTEHINNVISDGGASSLMRAQKYAYAHAFGMYSFVPNSDEAIELMSKINTNAVRLNAAGVEQVNDYNLDTTRHWVRIETKRTLAEYRRECAAFKTNGLITDAELPVKVIPILQQSDCPPIRGTFMNWYHWIGPGMKDVQRQAEDELKPFFTADEADAVQSERPEEIWLDGSWIYYWCTLSNYSLVSGTAPTTYLAAMARWGLECHLLKRPRYVAGQPIGVQDQAIQDAWFLANCLGDAWWKTTTTVWWTPTGGSQLPSPCVFDQTCPLAPWLDFTKVITTAEVLIALRHYLTTRAIAHIKAMREVVDSYS